LEKILIIDDEPDIRHVLSELLQTEGFEVSQADCGETGLKLIKKDAIDLVLLDKVIPEKMNGIEVLKEIKKLDPTIIVIILTGYGELKSAVEAMKSGAYDYLTKPFDKDELLLTVKRALETRSLTIEVKNLRGRLATRQSLEVMMGNSNVIKRIHSQVEKVATTDFTVLLQGESGTGKEIVAQAIHNLSLRKDGPFVAVDCGAIPDTLVESELFGYEKGAFTGADSRKEGQFELAHQGTIFLDEISNLPFQVQKKLLRLIQEKKVQHLGGKKVINVDVRIIAATNENVVHLVETGHFRSDLFYRLAEFMIVMPPLREREEDILHLADRFLKEANQELKKQIQGFTNEAKKMLLCYKWKGNVRELKNVIRRAVLLSEGDIGIEQLLFDNTKFSAIDSEYQVDLNDTYSLRQITKDNVAKIEKYVIHKALIQTRGNKNKAAKLLEVDYKTLHTKIKNYGINIRELRAKPS